MFDIDLDEVESLGHSSGSIDGLNVRIFGNSKCPYMGTTRPIVERATDIFCI